MLVWDIQGNRSVMWVCDMCLLELDVLFIGAGYIVYRSWIYCLLELDILFIGIAFIVYWSSSGRESPLGGNRGVLARYYLHYFTTYTIKQLQGVGIATAIVTSIAISALYTITQLLYTILLLTLSNSCRV